MPITPTYPGVYVQEIPSGVRTITGVSTSVTAFVGAAKRGPVNQAVHLLSFSDFERNFGGLDAGSEMSYAVRQFYLNGGSDAWAVRVALGAQAAGRTLVNADGKNVLEINALQQGKSGNAIGITIDYKTPNPASTFNLAFDYAPPDNKTDSVSEAFTDLSMNANDPRYVLDLVNGTSALVSVKRVADLSGLGQGTSVSGPLDDVGTIVTAPSNQFRVSVNGLPPVTVELGVGDATGGDPNARLDALCAAIQAKVRAKAPDIGTDLTTFQCVRAGQTISMTSGQSGEASSVRVLPGLRNEVSVKLKLGSQAGGTETDAVATLRPVPKPDPGTLTSADFGDTDLDALPDATHNSLQVCLDGGPPDTVSLGDTKASGANLAAKLTDVAQRLQDAVRKLKPAKPAYANFTCTAGAKNLTLASGTRGQDSSVLVAPADDKNIADALHLLSGTTVTPGTDFLLQNGDEKPFKPEQAYPLFIPDRSSRGGIYGLEAVDLFNLLCLPGVTDPGILADAAAYCEERRAFLIVDAPPAKHKPDEMVKSIAGTDLPKSDHGAVYYPWISIADPLRNGKPRLCAPCGTVAGLFARTDSTRGVWKAPAGTEATMLGVQSADYVLTDNENGTLNPHGVNCLRIFPVYGPVVWGARTLRGDDQMTSEYKYVPVRRLALYLEESLFRGLKWVVFEPNDEPLWAQIRLNVGAFLHNLFRQGAFQGKSPRQAYFVKCDSETTTQTDINLGVVNVLIGFAPLKPAEFVILSIQQMAGQIET
jgi:uncharacterized protein